MSLQYPAVIARSNRPFSRRGGLLVPVAAPTPDPNWANVVGLYSLNNSLVDSSTKARTLVATSGCSYAAGKFGTGSGSVPNTVGNGYVYQEGSPIADYDFRGVSATVEGWVWFNSITGTNYGQAIFTYARPGVSVWNCYVETNGKLAVASNVSASGGIGTTTPPTGQWVFISMTYDGSVARVHMDGVLQLSYTTAWPSPSGGSGGSWTLGFGCNGDPFYNPALPYTQPLNGRVDEVRITKGVARYTSANYTPPTAPFPTS